MKLALIVLVFLFSAGVSEAATQCIPHRDCQGKIKRSPAQVNAFKKTHPCPANGSIKGRCPGYVVDHITALCVCGKDRPSNMQWQTVADAKKKDRVECLTTPEAR